MKLVVFGPFKRLGGLLKDGEIVDLNLAYTEYLKDKGQTRPKAKADVELPAKLQEFLEEGDSALEAAKSALAYAQLLQSRCKTVDRLVEPAIGQLGIHQPRTDHRPKDRGCLLWVLGCGICQQPVQWDAGIVNGRRDPLVIVFQPGLFHDHSSSCRLGRVDRPAMPNTLQEPDLMDHLLLLNQPSKLPLGILVMD